MLCRMEGWSGGAAKGFGINDDTVCLVISAVYHRRTWSGGR